MREALVYPRPILLLRPQADSVGLDLRVERGGVHSQQARGTRLMTAGLLQRATNQVDLKAPHLIVEVDAAPKVLHRAHTGAFFGTTGNRLRIANLGPQT